MMFWNVAYVAAKSSMQYLNSRYAGATLVPSEQRWRHPGCRPRHLGRHVRGVIKQAVDIYDSDLSFRRGTV